MTAGLFNQCIAKRFHTIPSWLTTEEKQEHFYILFLSVVIIWKGWGEGGEERGGVAGFGRSGGGGGGQLNLG